MFKTLKLIYKNFTEAKLITDNMNLTFVFSLINSSYKTLNHLQSFLIFTDNER